MTIPAWCCVIDAPLLSVPYPQPEEEINGKSSSRSKEAAERLCERIREFGYWMSVTQKPRIGRTAATPTNGRLHR
jgi:hypothetical protein